ncbi:protein translocase SEC61 complex subunit gamma [Candidatus Woesearchaeota archaeon]|nr:protein translocase SEC61 complex subunit gamma [Candidatus Woesearchaeota archaeon]
MFIAKKRDEEKISAKPSWKERLWAFLRECKRVLKITKKPDKVELKTIVKISGLGIIAIGLIGFIIHFIKELLF